MKQRLRLRPQLEQLEDRLCPTLKTTFADGMLTIAGRPTGSGANQALLIMRVAATNYVVKDNATVSTLTGGSTIGTFNITRDLHLNLTSYSENILVDVNGGTFPGSIYYNLGLGAAGPSLLSVSVFGNGTAADRVNGSIYVSQGSGHEIFNVGQAVFGSPSPATSAVTVGGNLTFTGAAQTGFLGNTLIIEAGSSVAGNVTTTQVSQVTVGDFSFAGGAVDGNLTINDASAPFVSTVDVIGDVLGFVTVTGSNNGDIFNIINNFTGTPAFVGKSVNLNMGTGGGSAFSSNLITQDVGTVVAGNFTVTGGSGGNNAEFSGTIAGNLALNFGNGANIVALGNSTLATFNNPGLLLVGGYVIMNLGNGGNTVDFASGTTVTGSVYMTMGNGANTFTLDADTGDGAAQILGGTLLYTGGTTSDTVTIDNGLANPFNLYVTFKAGTRTLNLGLANPTTVNSAVIDFGVGGGTKNLNFNPAIVTYPIILRNYP